MIDSLTPSAWIARAIELLAASPDAVLASVAFAPAPPAPKLSRYERRFRRKDDALAPRDVRALVAHLPADAEVDVTFAFVPHDAPAWTITFEETIAVLRDETGEVRASVRVTPDPISRYRATDRLRWKSAALPARALSPLSPLRGERARVRGGAWSNAGPGTLSRIANYAIQRVRDLTLDEQWMVAFSFGGRDARTFHRIEPPRDRLWADPFVVQDGDRAWIFIEEMLFADFRGVLAVIEARRDGTWSPPVRILERPYHLSYPCVFRSNGAVWMVPESCGSGTVQLFRATDFPFRWEQHSVLLRDIEAVDATPFELDGRWWMYLTTAAAPNVFDELSLYSAPSLEGPWTPHRMNPLLSDLAGGRCAGRPFVRDGKILRAAQDGVKRYGHAMELREIVTLTDDIWEERVVERILPDWTRGLVGTHTLNIDGEVTVIDGARDRWRALRTARRA